MKTFLKVLDVLGKACNVFILTVVYGIGFVAALKFVLSD